MDNAYSHKFTDRNADQAATAAPCKRIDQHIQGLHPMAPCRWLVPNNCPTLASRDPPLPSLIVAPGVGLYLVESTTPFCCARRTLAGQHLSPGGTLEALAELPTGFTLRQADWPTRAPRCADVETGAMFTIVATLMAAKCIERFAEISHESRARFSGRILPFRQPVELRHSNAGRGLDQYFLKSPAAVPNANSGVWQSVHGHTPCL